MMVNLERYFFPSWMFIFISGVLIAFDNISSFFFMICVQLYLVSFGFINIHYAFNSRKNVEKSQFKEYFINEIITGILFFCLAVYYPFLFTGIPSEIKSQFYFHLWDSLTVHLLCWKIYLYFSKKNNIKKNRGFPYSIWKMIIIGMHNEEDDSKLDLKRKIMHFLTSAGVVGAYLLSAKVNSWLLGFGLTGEYITRYIWVVFGVHLIWIMNIQDLIRLTQFNRLGRFATRWLENSIRPKELNTFTSAAIMLLSWLPFVLAPFQVMMAAALIGANSDAMASILGKRFGKKKINSSKKTYVGLIAGGLSTILIINITHIILPFQNLSIIQIQILSLITAIAFMGIDYFVKNISDNFLNPIICGGIIWFFMLIF
ncbi:hypothetical protein WKT22_01519 [Candidatus Lokiarchaeum ossiferum]